ncbi:MAG: VWA domain-containing protein [Nitrospinaceae bacterium]
MRFGQPEYFHLLWLVPGFWFFFRWALQRRRTLAARFAGRALLPRLVSSRVWEAHQARALWWLLALVMLTGALAQPRWGFEWEDLRQEGVDVIVAVDVSASMLAADIKPNRLTRARRKVADLLNLLQGDRIGLVAFAGASFVQCPLTLDYKAVSMFLDVLDTDLIPVPGTGLGGAIRTAAKAFSQLEKKSKALILITDGEDHGGDGLQAAKEAQLNGIKIFTLGVGTSGGAPVPDPELGGFKKDEKGEVVLSRLDETLLQRIAGETGGLHVRSVTDDSDLEKIYLQGIKHRVEKKELKTSRRRRWQERFQWFLVLSLICLLAERGVREH